MMDSLPASLLRQWAYCPRIPFYREVLGLDPPMPGWVAQGEAYDFAQFTLSRDRRFRGLGIDSFERLRRVAMSDPAHRIHGIADLVLLGPDRLFVCDYKLRAERVERGARLQLAAYAIMAESQFGRPCSALLVLTGKPIRALVCPWTSDVRHEAETAIEEVTAMLDRGLLPASDAGPSKCGICEYLNYCNDRA